jgi:copper(I)-binding protein
MYGEGIVYLKIMHSDVKDTLIGIKTNILGASIELHEMKGNLMILANDLQILARK